MKAATVNELKSELINTPQQQLVDLCVRLAKFKKENKELITYLLFESFAWIRNIKKEMEEQFGEMNRTNVYFIKKSLRKILRTTNKYIRYAASAEAEIRLLIHFCALIKDSDVPVEKNPVIKNMYEGQLKKISKTIGTLHEDLQYDYKKELKMLE
jgi:hypothetical protein